MSALVPWSVTRRLWCFSVAKWLRLRLPIHRETTLSGLFPLHLQWEIADEPIGMGNSNGEDFLPTVFMMVIKSLASVPKIASFPGVGQSKRRLRLNSSRRLGRQDAILQIFQTTETKDFTRY